MELTIYGIRSNQGDHAFLWWILNSGIRILMVCWLTCKAWEAWDYVGDKHTRRAPPADSGLRFLSRLKRSACPHPKLWGLALELHRYREHGGLMGWVFGKPKNPTPTWWCSTEMVRSQQHDWLSYYAWWPEGCHGLQYFWQESSWTVLRPRRYLRGKTSVWSQGSMDCGRRKDSGSTRGLAVSIPFDGKPDFSQLDLKVCAWVCLMFFALQLDRGNIVQALSDNMLGGMNWLDDEFLDWRLLDDLNLSTDDFNMGQTIFYVSFLAAELPS